MYGVRKIWNLSTQQYHNVIETLANIRDENGMLFKVDTFQNAGTLLRSTFIVIPDDIAIPDSLVQYESKIKRFSKFVSEFVGNEREFVLNRDIYFQKPHIAKDVEFFISAWNNVVGFQQFQQGDVKRVKDREIEMLIRSKYDDINMREFTNIQDLLHIKNEQYVIAKTRNNKNVPFLGVARNMIYDASQKYPMRLSIKTLNMYDISSFLVFEHQVMDIDEFTTEIKKYADAHRRQFLVNFQGTTIFFVIYNRKDRHLVIELPGSSQCLIFGLNFENRTSELKSLFFDVYDKNTSCYNIASFASNGGFGKWMLRFIDRVNEILKMRYCTLNDESTLSGYSADCIYSKDHCGLSWYASHLYLVKKTTDDDDDDDDDDDADPDIDACIKESNNFIRKLVSFWNHVVSNNMLRRDVAPFEGECDHYEKKDGLDLIKFYGESGKMLNLHMPQNKLQPAIFLNSNDNKKPDDDETELQTRARILQQPKTKKR